MKRTNIILIIAILVTSFILCSAKSVDKDKDFTLVKEICKSQYNISNIKVFEGFSEKNDKLVTTRKNKNYIVVEKIKSISQGNQKGIDKEGQVIKYNKEIAKGQEVISYCIYNPNTNYFDDISWVVDSEQIR